MELSEVPLAEIRRRFLGEGRRVNAELLAGLRDDPRAGARALGRQLEARRQREVLERRRLKRLFRMERELRRDGVTPVAGLDEVGVGPLAGPVVAAAVVLPEGASLPGLNDSKQLSCAKREALDQRIRECALAISIAAASPAEIDELNIYHAALLAMFRAVEGLAVVPRMLLVDGRAVSESPIPQRAIPGGDGAVGCIAAASVVAKVHRDRLMREFDECYPGYGFAHNAGYGTQEHLRALALQGPTRIHRYSFAPVRGV